MYMVLCMFRCIVCGIMRDKSIQCAWTATNEGEKITIFVLMICWTGVETYKGIKTLHFFSFLLQEIHEFHFPV